ncbi:FecR family protein [Sphingomonas sp.]|uniref:FecR family protein n=1 Tax=Sphingomonas sp. TaxID=28214 RepID=UPI002DD66166|nr:FecR domain-containing protein [Sphingomonas sp.]
MPGIDDTERDPAYWAARLDRGGLGHVEQIELEQWLAADERNQGDLLRARAALVYVAHDFAAADAARPSQYRSSGFALPWLVAAVASLLLFAVIGLPMMARPDAEIQTAVGELRKVPLADGSVVTINTASALQVRLSPDRRALRLERGEALFEVASDTARPFVVEVGTVSVRAVGTTFSVRRRDTGVEIHVVEGVVETWIEGAESPRKRVHAGERGFVSLRAADIAVSADQGASLAWRDGLLEFNDTPLATAVSEINRYNTRKIVLDDPALGQQTLVGSFRANDPEGFANAARELFDARIFRDDKTIRISPSTR